MAESAVRAEDAASEPARDNVHVLPPRFAGHVDSIENGFVRGWARDEAAPGSRTLVEIYLGDHSLGTTTADRYREDLIAAGMGDGRHGFAFPLPPEARDAPAVAIGVYFAGTRIPLVRPDGTTAPLQDDAGLAELSDLTQALRDGLERLASRVAALGREQTRLGEQGAAIARELEQHTGTAEAERRKAVEAAALAVRDETRALVQRVETVEKSFADVDAFLVRIDSSLRKMATTPEPRAAGGSVALALAIFAVFASGLAILAALAPSAFQDLLRPVLG
ncbi:hypothetical protein STAQ_17980 [Allostella sp. ATCC 35155]|nr:hypothetical protein STAQ_17980 [Stella sp. ATCC 35155]